VYLQYRSSAKDLARRLAIVAVAELVSPRKQGLAMGLSKEEYHRMSRPKSNKVEKKSKQQQSLASNVQFKSGIQSKPTLLSPAADPFRQASDAAIAFPIAPEVQGDMQEAGMPTSKQRGRVQRSTRTGRGGGSTRTPGGRGNQDIGWRAAGTIEGCGSGWWDARGLKRRKLAARAVREACMTAGY
jgi:hypothetical protein